MTILSFVSASLSLISTFLVASFSIPMIAVWTDELHLSSANIALTSLSYFAGCLITLLFFSRISNFFGRKPIVILSLILTVIASLIFANGNGPLDLYVARLLQGFSCGLASSATMAWVVECAPKNKSWLGQSLTAAGPNVGLAIGCIGSGYIISYEILNPTTLFYLSIISQILSLILVLLSRETIGFGTQTLSQVLIPKLTMPKRLFRLFIISALTFIVTWSVGGFLQGFSASFALQIFGHSDPFLTALIYLLYILPNCLFGIYAGKFNPRVALLILISIFTLSGLTLFFSVNFKYQIPFLMAIILAGLSAGGAVTSALRFLIMDLSLTERAGVLATLYFSAYLGSSLPNFVVSLIDHLTQENVTLGFTAWILLIFTIIFSTYFMIKKKPTEAESLRFKRN